MSITITGAPKTTTTDGYTSTGWGGATLTTIGACAPTLVRGGALKARTITVLTRKEFLALPVDVQTALELHIAEEITDLPEDTRAFFITAFRNGSRSLNEAACWQFAYGKTTVTGTVTAGLNRNQFERKGVTIPAGSELEATFAIALEPGEENAAKTERADAALAKARADLEAAEATAKADRKAARAAAPPTAVSSWKLRAEAGAERAAKRSI